MKKAEKWRLFGCIVLAAQGAKMEIPDNYIQSILLGICFVSALFQGSAFAGEPAQSTSEACQNWVDMIKVTERARDYVCTPCPKGSLPICQELQQDCLAAHAKSIATYEAELAKCSGKKTIAGPNALPSCADAPAIQQRVNHTQEEVARDTDAIRSLGFSKNVDDVQDWLQLSTDAKSKFNSEAFSWILGTVSAGVRAGGSLNPPSANRAVTYLREHGVDFRPLNNAIRKLAATPGKPPTAAAIKDFLENVDKVKETVELGNSVGEENFGLQALATVLGWTVKDPQLSFLLTDLNFTTASVYNNVTRRLAVNEIDQLMRTSEANLTSLKRLYSRA